MRNSLSLLHLLRAGLTALLLAPVPALAQGFAGLGTDAAGFAVPEHGTVLTFPRDHGPHPEYRIEWWYLTANLKGEDGRDYGIQWTLFRSALAPEERPGWDSPQIWMGHAALTTEEAHYHSERLARGGIGQAGVTADPFAAWIDDWQMQALGDGIDRLDLSANGPEFSYRLHLQAKGPLVLHGEDGYSVKSASGQASYYYSQPRYQVEGTVNLPSGPVQVTGQAWLDREWSSQPLEADQTGWDWFSLSFDTGDKLMGFILRGGTGDFTSGTWIDPAGTATPLPPGTFAATPLAFSKVAGRSIPTRWQVSLPERGLTATVEALNPQAWMGTSFPYWEGPVRISGSHHGLGYLEMTGYAPE
ncbi:lipocalin-like domain-containing protein [Phaeobacter sp. PT47_59]|uniref:lipocalin-like domain-containing protein n=1 Tax=Phaeobacter sp. PT47_59 TaxID=3029979 RepID=UPI0023803A6C|nr:lipocalin-like domain-containing protein [Phaeobacter sp. PT47_59]MDE4172581.1 lipocalin-like domain-containing protein [Phaeobacter sp. PT47_59]